MIRIGLVTALSLLAAACGSAPHEITLYLKRDIGSSVPPGQIAPVLAPTVRRVDSQPPSPARVLALLQQGPTSDEADDGFLPTIPSSVHILGVRVSDGTATVNFGGSAPQAFYTHAASSRSPICPGSTRWPCVTTASPAASTPLMGRSPPPRSPGCSIAGGQANRAPSGRTRTLSHVEGRPNSPPPFRKRSSRLPALSRATISTSDQKHRLG